MAFNISGAAIRNPIPPLVLFTVLTLLGVWAFMALPITRSPNIDIPIISVTVTQPGAAPGELEALDRRVRAAAREGGFSARVSDIDEADYADWLALSA